MSSSSTSSSERTLRLRGWSPTSALVCLAVLVVFELVVGRAPEIWTVVPRSNSGIIDQMEARVIEPSQPPRLLILGSSRIRDAVLPIELEQALGLDRGDAMNLATTAGTPFDALTLLRRNPKLLERVDRAVLGVEDWYVDGTYPHNERDARFTTIAERWQYPSRISLLVGAAWHSYGANRPIRRYVRRMGRRAEDVPLLPDGRFEWRTNAESHEEPARRADALFKSYETTTHRMEQLAELRRMLESAGASVVIVQVPLHPEYSQRMRDEYSVVTDDLHRLVRQNRGEARALLWGDDPEGLSAQDFFDYGHLEEPGARVFTRRLASEISTEPR